MLANDLQVSDLGLRSESLLHNHIRLEIMHIRIAETRYARNSSLY